MKPYDDYTAINAHSRIMKVIYPVKGAFSVWVGTFKTKDSFDACIFNTVEPRLGFTTDLTRFSEVAFESSVVPVKDLLRGFSSGPSFYLQAINAADRLGLEFANAALVCFNLSCKEGPAFWGELRFLGTFFASDESGD
jgi:hypothetical protein